MSVSGQSGYVSFAVQPAKVGTGLYDPTTYAWLNHRALGADVSFQQLINAIPPELGAGMFSAGEFKEGVFVAGGLALNARMENSIGALIYAAAGHAAVGAAQSASLVDATTAPTAGAPSSGGLVTPGTHSYKYTFVSNSGETLPSTASGVSTAIITTGQTVGLTGILAGPTGTIARKVYRTAVGDAGPYLLLATISDNVTTIFSDTIADASLGIAAPALNTTALTIADPVLTPTVGTATTGGTVTLGTHSYRVTYYDTSGESLPGPISAIGTAAGSNQTIPLSAIPLGPTGTVGRKIYRTATGNTGAYQLLTTIADNTTTVFSDTVADASLGAVPPVLSTTTFTSGSTIFSVSALDDTQLPWVTLRKVVPGDSAGGYEQDLYYDCRVAALSITVPQTGLLTAEVAFVGRVPVWIDGKPATGTGLGQFGAAFESAASAGHSGEGSIILPGFTAAELPAGGQFTSAQIIAANQLSSPQEEMVVGSYNPTDLAVLSRGALVRLVYRWKDASLYRTLHMLAAGGGGVRQWNPIMRSSDVHVVSQSQSLVAGFTNKYRFDFYAPQIDWVMSPVMLAPKKLLQVELIGTIKQATGVPTWQVELYNNGVALNNALIAIG